MILTALQWTALATAFLFLIIIALPIRFGGSMSYRKSGKGSCVYRLWIYYAHPLIYRIEYSPENECRRTTIFGFERRNNAGGDGSDDGNLFGDDYEYPRAGKPEPAGLYGDDCRASVREEKAVHGAGEMVSQRRARGRRRKRASPFESLLSAIKRYGDDIRGNNYYKAISDRPLRKKLFKWLGRFAGGIFTVVSFDRFSLRGRIGYGDPAALGQAYGYFIAAREALLLRNLSVDMAMEPVFTEECLDIDMEAAGRTSISVILWYLLVIAATFPYLRLRKVTKTEKGEAPA